MCQSGTKPARGQPGEATIVKRKLACYNAENFYMLLDRLYSPEEYAQLPEADYLAMNHSIYNPNKAKAKIAAIADTIMGGDFDVIGLCEVGGLETLENFNRLCLDNRYHCYLHQENSRRGIFVGALVRKGRFTGVQAKNIKGNFSRNLLKLELSFGPSRLHLFVVHLKSQLGPDFGIEQRIKEVEQLTSLARHRNCVVMGDFNGSLVPGEVQFEFQPFLDLGLQDVLEQLGVPPNERFTHFYFGDKPHFNQLDYIFCSPDIEVLGGGVLADTVPINYEQRQRLPSDHLFLTAEIRLSAQ